MREEKICPMCKRKYAQARHHLIFGSSLRRLADEDALYLDLCDDCHNMGKLTERIHDNPAAEALSKMLGQAIWEMNDIAKGSTALEARDHFLERYGQSFL